MKTCLLHAKNRKNALWKAKASSKQPKLLSLKTIKTVTNESVGRRINVKRIDPEAIHNRRVMFNEQHFGCKQFHHQNGKETWIIPTSKEKNPAMTVKRIMQILVPSDFFYITDKTRKKVIYKRDVHHRVISQEETVINIKAHSENAVKEMLIKEGVDENSIMTRKNVCYITLHKQMSEEKIREMFPTLHIRVFKVMRKQ